MLVTVGQIKQLISESSLLRRDEDSALERFVYESRIIENSDIPNVEIKEENFRGVVLVIADVPDDVSRRVINKLNSVILGFPAFANNPPVKHLGTGFYGDVYELQDGKAAKVDFYVPSAVKQGYLSDRAAPLWAKTATQGNIMIYSDEKFPLTGFARWSEQSFVKDDIGVRIVVMEKVSQTLKDWVIAKGLPDPDEMFNQSSRFAVDRTDLIWKVSEHAAGKRILGNPELVDKLVKQAMKSGSVFTFAEEREFFVQTARYLLGGQDPDNGGDWAYRNIGIQPAKNEAGFRLVFFDT